MLREEVLTKWESCKAKLATVRLTPKEKETWKFLERSKVSNFSHHIVPADLDQLRKDIEVEQRKDMETDENELLCDYSFCWMNFCSLILDWIDLNRTTSFFRDENKKIKDRISDMSNNILDYCSVGEDSWERDIKAVEENNEKLHSTLKERSKRTRKFIWQFEKALEVSKGESYEQQASGIHSLVTNMMSWFDYERDILGTEDEESWFDKI